MCSQFMDIGAHSCVNPGCTEVCCRVLRVLRVLCRRDSGIQYGLSSLTGLSLAEGASGISPAIFRKLVGTWLSVLSLSLW